MCLTLLLALVCGVATAEAAGGTRTLTFYYTHTKETGTFTFRKNGSYDTKVLADLNYFLRDWRRNEPTKMDPALFDLIWEVYQQVGGKQPIHVVSAYRAPATNEMLRSNSNGVAKNSRHTMGMAMDFFIPGVPLKTLREAAMKKQVGGVGYYPTSGSPFVHLDTGNVRAWPRMTKAQLTKLFPDGKTLHLPSEGNTPLSEKGYQLAKADWTKCHTIPCSAKTATTSFAVAQNDSQPTAGNGKTLLDWLFGNDEADEAAVDADVPTVAIASVPAVPPVPAARPVSFYSAPESLPFGTGSDPLATELALAEAPVPQARPFFENPKAATGDAVFTVASVSTTDIAPPTPAPQVLPTPQELAPVVSAYVPSPAPEPDAQRALAMILERRAAPIPAPTVTASAAPTLNTTGFRAGVSGADGAMLSNLITGTMQAIAEAPPVESLADFEMRAPSLVAPDIAHAAQLLVDPAFISSDHYAIIFDHELADLSPATELGHLAPKLTIGADPAFGMGQSFFAHTAPLLVASR